MGMRIHWWATTSRPRPVTCATRFGTSWAALPAQARACAPLAGGQQRWPVRPQQLEGIAPQPAWQHAHHHVCTDAQSLPPCCAPGHTRQRQRTMRESSTCTLLSSPRITHMAMQMASPQQATMLYVVCSGAEHLCPALNTRGPMHVCLTRRWAFRGARLTKQDAYHPGHRTWPYHAGIQSTAGSWTGRSQSGRGPIALPSRHCTLPQPCLTGLQA